MERSYGFVRKKKEKTSSVNLLRNRKSTDLLKIKDLQKRETDRLTIVAIVKVEKMTMIYFNLSLISYDIP